MAASNKSKFNVTLKIQHCCKFEWCLDSFPPLNGNLFSPKFRTAEDCPLIWTIILKLDDTYQSNKMKLKFETSDKSTNKLNVLFSYEIYAGDCLISNNSTSKNDISNLINKNNGLEILCPQYVNQGQYYDSFSRNGMYSRQRNQPAEIIIKGNVIITNCCQTKPNKLEITNKYLPQLQTDFKSLLKNQEFTDVALNVGNEVIGAHKFVLCARSPVFRRMFEQNFKESVHNSVDIKDMEKSVVENFLNFLYSGVVEDRKFKTVTALYSAADKYEVKTLQEACREILISCLSENTTPVILKLADMHNDNNLKEIAIVYICDNFGKVEVTTEWNHLLDTDPRLSSYTLRRVSTNMSK